MDLSTFLNQNLTSGKMLFEPKYINVEYVFYKIYLFLNEYFGVGKERLVNEAGKVVSGDVAGSFAQTSGSVSKAGDFMKGLLYIIILFSFTLICYCFVRILEIRKREHDYMHHETHEYYHKRGGGHGGGHGHGEAHGDAPHEEDEKTKNPRWQAVLDYRDSHNQGDWKLAILEADGILDSLLDTLNLPGDSLGDKLKAVDMEKFPKLNTAWEVHNIRNRIAHEGSSVNLSEHETKRVLHIYEQIFRDYNFI